MEKDLSIYGEGESGRAFSLRRGSLWVFVLGVVGLAAELLLMGHFEEWRQQVPLALLGASLLVLAARSLWATTGMLRLFRWLSGAFVVAGGVGVWLHLGANIEFELEMYPSQSGLELLWNAASGALPALAPGALAQLGLVGLLYTYRHPALGRAGSGED
jgi:hypothetical protein